MKLLWLSHFVPFPPRGGAHQRSFNLIRQVCRSHELTLVALNLQGESGERLADYARELGRHCACVEFWELPYPWRGARWHAQLVLSSLSRIHHGARALWCAGLNSRWEQTLRRHSWTLVHFDSPDLALFVPAAARFRKVLNHHNCESAMTYRRAERESNALKKAYLWLQARKLERLESEISAQFNVNVAVSELDAKTLQTRNPEAHFHVVENGTDTRYFLPAQGIEEPNSLIFAGSLNWYPNVSGLQFFVRGAWPLIKQHAPDARFYVAGQSPPEALIRWLRQDPNIQVVANPRDIRPWFARASVFVCPMLDGGGTKLKILDAMAMGRPVVSTTVGCEGLRVSHGNNILVGDTPQDFAGEVIRLLSDSGLRRRLGEAGRKLVEMNYSWEIIGGHLEQGYRCAVNGRGCQTSAA